MLTPDRIKSFLIHADPDVRHLATEYFNGSWSDDPDLLPMVLDACEIYGIDEWSNLYNATHFTITEASLDRLLKLLETTEDEQAIGRLNRIIDNAPCELLQTRLEAITNHPNILPKTRLRISRRLDLLDWSAKRLWNELQDFAHRSEDRYFIREIDHDYADVLIDALSRHNVPDAETICRLLKELEPGKSWLEIFLVILAGKRRLREAVPILVDKFQIDTDYLLECCSDALARISDPEAIRLIRQAFPDAPFHYRLFTTAVLGNLKHPESETAILALLESETDSDIRV